MKAPDVERNRKSRPVRMLAVLTCVAMACAGCTTARIPLTKIDVPMIDIPLPDMSFLLPPIFRRGSGDLHHMKWTEAFDAMHLKLQREYPFTAQRAVDWRALYNATRPDIVRAQKRKDADAYYLALRKYMYSVPDGNMRISANDTLEQKVVGGTFGFEIAQLDDGRMVASRIAPGGPADKAGMKWGAEIIEWDRKPVKHALEQVTLEWANVPPATADGRLAWQCRLLTRGPVGTKQDVRFKNEGAEEATSAVLAAVKSEDRTLERAAFDQDTASDDDSPVQWKMIDGGYAYVHVRFEGPSPNTPYPALAFKKAIVGALEKNASGLVLDVRGNSGGDGDLVPKFLGHFFQTRTFFRDAAFFNADTGAFEVDPKARLDIVPADPYFSKPVVVLIDTDTFSAGEGIPLALRTLPNVRVIGFTGTHGSFGIVGGDMVLPCDITVSYPVGQARDEKGAVLVDGNGLDQGGVAPGDRLALTRDRLRATIVDGRDVLLDEALAVLRKAAAQ